MSERGGPLERLRWLLAADAMIAALLGALFLFYPSSIVDPLGLPSPDPAIYANLAGALLVGFAFALGRSLRRPEFSRPVVEAAMIANALSAAVLVVWLAALDDGATTTGTAVLGVVAGALAALALLQGRALRGWGA
jgi:drug/metabolite transporter (DMT)-like permease